MQSPSTRRALTGATDLPSFLAGRHCHTVAHTQLSLSVCLFRCLLLTPWIMQHFLLTGAAKIVSEGIMCSTAAMPAVVRAGVARAQVLYCQGSR